ncbi:MAG: cytochrome c3 family protein, partial [Candidatus Krumholzibacteriia bacterium]
GRHRVFPIFVDGVPHPDSVQAQNDRAARPAGRTAALGRARGWGREIPGVATQLHPPFEEGECSVCHQTRPSRRFSGNVSLVMPVRELCVECHDDMTPEALSETYEWLHGPVSSGNCTTCHSPHRSTQPFLLRAEPTRALCLRCHDLKRLRGTPAHADPAGGACTSCHGAHGGPAPAWDDTRLRAPDPTGSRYGCAQAEGGPA